MEAYIKDESNYTLKIYISENDYFCVQKVEKMGTQNNFIKKIFKFQFDETQDDSDNKKDISFLIAMQNRHMPFAILESFSIPTTPNDYYYVMTEFMKNRDLKTALNCAKIDLITSWDKAFQYQPDFDDDDTLNQLELDDTRKMKICYGVAFGLNQMHKNGIVHGNLKPSNILISNEYEPLITGFIFIKKILLDEEFQNQCDNEHLIYMAPELLDKESKKLDYKSDVYAYSVIVDQLLGNGLKYGKHINPFTVKKSALRNFIANKKSIYKIPETVPEPFAKILEKNLSHDPENRDTMETFLNYFDDPENPALFPKYDKNSFKQYVDSLKSGI